MTNGDKIRQMSDEELATWLTKLCIGYAFQTISENNLHKYVKPPSAEALQEISQDICNFLQEEVQEDVQEDG